MVVTTLVLGALGAISAAMRAGKAKAAGHSTRRYWVAFWVPFVPYVIFWTAWIVNSGPDVDAASVEQAVLSDPGAERPAAAACAAEMVDSDGVGTYSCLLTAADGSQGTFRILVSADGRWVAEQTA